MKIYKKIMVILLMAYIILYPILPTYGKFSGDIILYSLIVLEFIGIIFIKSERKNIKKIIKDIMSDKVFTALICLNIIMYISSIFSINKVDTIKNSIRFSMYLFVFYMVTYKIGNKYKTRLIVNSFILSAFLSGIGTVYQILKTISLGYSIDATVRMTSFLENSNNLGTYSILAFFVIIMLLIDSKEKWRKILYGITSILLIVNIVFSQSRNALLALVLGVFILAILYDKRIIIVSMILPVILMIIPESRARIIQIFDMSQNSSRLNIWGVTEKIIKDNPITGIGYENFQYAYPQYVNQYPQFKIEEGYVALHPHNIFLKFQSELGIIGLIMFCIFIFFTVKMIFNLTRKVKDKTIKNISIGIFVGFLTFTFMNIIDSYYSAPKVIISMFLLIALANHYDKLEKKVLY